MINDKSLLVHKQHFDSIDAGHLSGLQRIKIHFRSLGPWFPYKTITILYQLN